MEAGTHGRRRGCCLYLSPAIDMRYSPCSTADEAVLCWQIFGASMKQTDELLTHALLRTATLTVIWLYCLPDRLLWDASHESRRTGSRLHLPLLRSGYRLCIPDHFNTNTLPLLTHCLALAQ